MKKKLKKGSALALALVLTLSTVVMSKVQAAISIETDRQCSVKFELDAVYPELSGENMTIPVRMYKVADVNQYGEYQALAGFEELKLDSISSKTTAQEWEEKAKSAVKAVEENQTEATASDNLIGGKGSVDGLSVGMYLVEAEEVQSPYYTYSFTPYLISLPNNYYYQTGDDEWVYELSEVVLKPEQTPRYGSLVIDKTLRDFNATSGAQATFVFQIDITTLEGKTESRVEAMTMGAGEESQQLTIDQIPAGASVRVRETYSGASYTQVSDDPDDVTIFADEAVRVSFENAHDGRPNGGYGVKNNFKLDENKQYQYTGDNVSTD